MPEQALYLKWRPLSFDDVVGQQHITRTLRNALARGRIRHAYLFSGPRGTGKTTTARLLAKAVNCAGEDLAARPCNACANCVAINEGRYLDLIEIDAASHTGVDDVRELRDKIAFAPGEGAYKVYIIDEVHRFSGNAFDALLKTLEEPPDHALFVLATTEIDKVPATIKSRCLQFEFRRVSLRELTARLAFIAEEEALSIEPAALELIARQGAGSVRDSISLLDQIVADPAETVTLEMARDLLGTASAAQVQDLVEALVDEDVARGIHLINMAIDSGSDPRQFGQQLVNDLRNIMLAQTASADLVEATQEDQARYADLADRIQRARLLKAIRAFNAAVNNYTGGWQPQLSLELAFIEVLEEETPVAVPAPVSPPASAGQQRPRQEQAAPATMDYERAPASQPGEAPIFSAAKIHQGWQDILSRAYQYDKNIPPLFSNVMTWRIDGNNLNLGVGNQVFLQKMSDPKRAKVIEQAIYDLHDVKLLIKVRVVESGQAPVDAAPAERPAVDDPLIAAGKELGGVVGE